MTKDIKEHKAALDRNGSEASNELKQERMNSHHDTSNCGSSTNLLTTQTHSLRKVDLYPENMADLGRLGPIVEKTVDFMAAVSAQRKREIQVLLYYWLELDLKRTRCDEYKAMLKVLMKGNLDNVTAMSEKLALIEEGEARVLQRWQDEAAKGRMTMKEVEEEWRVKSEALEVDPIAKLHHYRIKLETALIDGYRTREETLRQEMKKRQGDDAMRIDDLEIENKRLLEEFEKQREKLRQAESKCKQFENLSTMNKESTHGLRGHDDMPENGFVVIRGS